MILAVLQARMGSTRLPGKSMATLRGEPMIIRQLERLRGARCLSKIIVATSADTVDDALAGFLVSRGYTVHRGAGADILARIARCAETISSVSHVVRLKGDAPFIDPGVIDEAIRLALASGADYTSNRVQQTYPAGLDVEVIKAGALQAAAAEERDPMARISPMRPALKVISLTRSAISSAVSGSSWRTSGLIFTSTTSSASVA